MKVLLKIFSVFIFLFIVSCNKEEIPDDNFNASQNFNRTIRFEVYHVYDFSPISDSAVGGAIVTIYENYEDFLTEYYPDATRTTDSSGKCEIGGLDKDKYYIRCVHPAFSNIIDSVTTPSNTTSFVEMLFY